MWRAPLQLRLHFFLRVESLLDMHIVSPCLFLKMLNVFLEGFLQGKQKEFVKWKVLYPTGMEPTYNPRKQIYKWLMVLVTITLHECFKQALPLRPTSFPLPVDLHWNIQLTGGRFRRTDPSECRRHSGHVLSISRGDLPNARDASNSREDGSIIHSWFVHSKALHTLESPNTSPWQSFQSTFIHPKTWPPSPQQRVQVQQMRPTRPSCMRNKGWCSL